MSAGTNAKARILVVDDSKLMRKAAQKMLGDEFDVELAEDGLEAWGLLERDHSLQVLFTDLNMPRMDGFELLRQVRESEDEDLKHLPVIIVTGAEDDEGARMQALTQGATDFITKPFTTTDLIARARAHANYQRRTRELQSQVMLDAMTGLANRAGYLDRLQQDLAYARRHGGSLTVVRLQVDALPRLFLQQGKAVAEAVIKEVAARLRARIRKEDTAARIGLGGFALSLPGGEAEGIEQMVMKLRRELANQPPRHEGQPVPITLTAAVFSPDAGLGHSAEDVLAFGDEYLEQARQAAEEANQAAEAEATRAAEARAAEVQAKAAARAAAEKAAAEQAAKAAASEAAEAARRAASERKPAPAAAAEPAPVPLDPLLASIEAGETEAVRAQLPGAVRRLVPLLRLLSASQRAQLVRFLQALGTAGD